MEHKLNIKKIIVLACPAGRVGSSAIMGMLDLAGFPAGKVGRVIGSGGMNPKGFFELYSQEKFLSKAFRGYYPGPTIPPNIKNIDSISSKNLQGFKRFLAKEFAGETQVAIKAPRWLTLPFYSDLANEFDVRVVSLTRSLDKQVESTYRVWQQTYDPILMRADKHAIRSWLMSWQDFSEEMRDRYASMQIYEVGFDELMQDPVTQSQAMLKCLGVQGAESNIIRKWFDASLVGREALPTLPRLEVLKRMIKRSAINAMRKPFMHYSPYIVKKTF